MPAISGSMNCFTEGYDPPDASGQLPLYMLSTVGNFIPDKIPLYINSTVDPTHSMNLFVDGGTGDISANVNLFVQNIIPSMIDSLNLYISGSSTYTTLDWDTPYVEYILGLSGSGLLLLEDDTYLGLGDEPGLNYISLFLQGSPGYPVNANMNLFMARDSEAVCSNISLYMAQNETINEANLFIEGNFPANSSVPLYIYGSGDPITNNIKFYTHGY